MEQGLGAEQGHGAEVRGAWRGAGALSCGLRGAPGKTELAGWRGGRNFSKLAYLASKVNTNLRSLSREGAVQ